MAADPEDIQRLMNYLNKSLKEKGLSKDYSVHAVEMCQFCGELLYFDEVNLDYLLAVCDACKEKSINEATKSESE